MTMIISTSIGTMKSNKLFHQILIALALVAGLSFTGCQQAAFEEITELNLSRCLEPMNLKARVNNSLGDVVTFSWDVTKDAESYLLSIYTDEGLTQKYLSETVAPGSVPYQKKLDADQTYYFTVQAMAQGKAESKVAVCSTSVKTFAVKDNLFMKVTARSATSVSLAWSTEVSDYQEVDRIEYGAPGSDEMGKKTLSASEIAAGAATVDGLTASTDYEFILFFKSASRGMVNAWTTPDVSGFTPVSSLDALLNAMKTPGAKILLKMDGSPYEIESLEIAGGFSIIGEGEADGTMPVLQGELSFADTWAGGNDLYFEGVEFNGSPTAASPSGFGFAIQNKNGGTVDNKEIGNITYKNCVITNYTKGLIYEWGKPMVLGNITYESCDITNINPDGTVGGDCFDLRQASTLKTLSFVDNTIWQGMRTFIRIDAATVGGLVFDNNTVQNLCFADNANNAGIFGLQVAPGSVSFKNNLFLNMAQKATLGSANAKYKTAADLGVSASNNWYYNVVETFFTESWPAGATNFKAAESDPCYNAPGGLFNLVSGSELASAKVGASKWWTPYVEEPEDLTLNVIPGKKTWNLANAKYFSGTMKKQMVRDDLMINASESSPIVAGGGMLQFQGAAVTNRAGVPTDGYLVFKVDGPGSILLKVADPESLGNHVVIGVGPVDGSEIAIKGGASALADMGNAQKILITTITEESLVYIYPSGPVSLAQLAWSTDVTPVNTALQAPAPEADPSTMTAGEATDIVISWEAVPEAASYSVVFMGKSNLVDGETTYTISSTTTGMLDAGSYKVEVIANPGKDDIYNTESAAGTAVFAVLPKGGGGEGDELVVTTVEALLSAIEAGKSEITLAPGEYDLAGQLTVTAPLSLKGQPGAAVTGAFKLSGAVGTFKLSGLTVKANGQGNLIELDATEGVTADEITVENTVVDGFAKSVIYASNAADKFDVGKLTFNGIEVYNQGTGQGMFDLRNGKWGDIAVTESTLTGGRDWLRVDATCNVGTITVKNNTMYALNAAAHGNGIFFVRATPASYVVSDNLIHTTAGVLAKSGATVPSMRNNYFYGENDKLFTGAIDQATALGGGGVMLTGDPCKNVSGNDFTLTNAVVMSAKAGASKWNPMSDSGSTSGSFTVSSVEEYEAAVAAGKTDIKFAAGSYDLSAAAITLPAGMRLSGEPGAEITVTQFNLAEGDLGTIVIENLRIKGKGSNNLLQVSGATIAKSVIVRNCEISGIGKSLFYGNGDGSEITALVFNNVFAYELGGSQGTIDIRKGTYTTVSVEQSTFVGGRDFIRADASRVTGAVNIVNNTFDGVTLSNGNGILYVRSTPESYVVKNNLFLNENGDNCKLSKDTGITVPTSMTGNFFYGCTAEAFWTGLINQEVATAGGGVILSANPVKNAAGRDYTLVDALCLSSNVGAARWNPNSGRTTSEITVSTVEELSNAIGAGKTAITLKSGTYDLRTLSESGVMTLVAPLSLEGEVIGGQGPEIIGGFKFGAGTTSFSARGLRFNGAEKALGNAFEIVDAVDMDQIVISGCDIYGYNKSLYYGNGTGKVGYFTFENNLVHGFGTGQGMIDIRKGSYDAVTVTRSTFYDGGRDFIRCDKEIAASVAITSNTFGSCSINAGNGLLWVRSCAADPTRYTVSKNLFLNMTGSTVLAKTGATVPTMNQNYFFNLGEGFFGGAISQEVAVTGGAVLEADPCKESAAFSFKVVDAALKTAGIGDPRWL